MPMNREHTPCRDRVVAEYVIGRGTSPQVMAELAARMGGRLGDTVLVYLSGRVKLERWAGEDEADVIVSALSENRPRRDRSRAARAC